METLIVIIWTLWLMNTAWWVYVEKNTEKVWHIDSFPRDSRGRIAGRKTREYYNRLKSGRIIPASLTILPWIVLLMAGFVISGVYYMGQ